MKQPPCMLGLLFILLHNSSCLRLLLFYQLVSICMNIHIQKCALEIKLNKHHHPVADRIMEIASPKGADIAVSKEDFFTLIKLSIT